MTTNQKTTDEQPSPLAKAPTGIEGLDQITAGGLPAGRPTIDTIGAKRVVLDTIEALFAGLPNQAILRSELRRMFRYRNASDHHCLPAPIKKIIGDLSNEERVLAGLDIKPAGRGLA